MMEKIPKKYDGFKSGMKSLIYFFRLSLPDMIDLSLISILDSDWFEIFELIFELFDVINMLLRILGYFIGVLGKNKWIKN